MTSYSSNIKQLLTLSLEDYDQLLSVKFGLIFGTEENKNLFKLNFRQGQLYNKNQRRGTNSANWFS